jgi:RsiW-degrading membrane proteinase PrsW (M82 family)
MEDVLALPPGVALAIIAFLLSLLPAGLFLWLWYLRRTDRPVPPSAVAVAFGLGAVLVWIAFQLESQASMWWARLWPATAHYFGGAILPLQTVADVLWPAVATFLVVALIEEGLRYVVLRFWYRYSKAVDQVFDGLVLGVAAGLGFATLENTLYFLDLFRAGSFDTLVFVFFLRFLISTLAHIGFGGVMGALIARGVFSMGRYHQRSFYLKAFIIPWLGHGFFDLLLGVNLSLYAVLILVPFLVVLLVWSMQREFFVLSRSQGQLLVVEKAPETNERKVLLQFLKQFNSPWNIHAPWLGQRRHHGKLLSELEK